MRRHAFHGIHAARYPRALLLLLCVGACSGDPDEERRDSSPALTPDASNLGSDAGEPGDALDVAHVPPAGAFSGTGSLILQGGVTIDTDNLTVDGQTYAGGPGDDIVFDVWEQALPGPELAVLHVYDFGVKDGTVTVSGSRPLVIIAGNEIRLAGMIEAAARGTQAGPGGFGSALGPGAGSPGQHAGQGQDGGGGGGGHGSAGAMGGSGVCVDGVCGTGGNGGAAFGTSDLQVLQGGAGGGTGSSLALTPDCVPAPGGGGGGAVQLTAMDRIRIDAGGGVHAGGGGGRGGAFAGACNDNGAGGGGGAGGAIFLQAPAIEHRGVLAANGGGGGSGASGSQFPGSNGLASDQPAPGGQEAASVAFAGGCGFARADTGCSHEGGSGDGNGGGGGGGVGRIVVVTAPNSYDDDDSITSPAANISTR